MFAWERATVLWAKQVSVLLLASIVPSHPHTEGFIHFEYYLEKWLIRLHCLRSCCSLKLTRRSQSDARALTFLKKSTAVCSFSASGTNFTNCSFKIHLKHLNWTLISIKNEDVWAWSILYHETASVTKAKCRRRKKMAIDARGCAQICC